MSDMKVDQESELRDVRRVNDDLSKELDVVRVKHASLKIRAVTSSVELTTMKEQYAILVHNGSGSIGDGSVTDAEFSGVTTIGGLSENYVELSARFKDTKNELNRLQRKYEESQDSMHAYREQWTAVDVENRGLVDKCEVSFIYHIADILDQHI